MSVLLRVPRDPLVVVVPVLVLLLLVVQRLQRALAGRVIRRLDLRVVHRGGGLMLLLVMRGGAALSPGRWSPPPSSRHGRVANAYARCCCKDCSSKAFRAACLMTVWCAMAEKMAAKGPPSAAPGPAFPSLALFGSETLASAAQRGAA